MSLNIKNPEVHALAREAARVGGTSQVGAVEQALRLYLRQFGDYREEAQRQRKVDLVWSIVEEYQLEVADQGLPPMDPEDLYDDAGLPA